MIIAAAMVMGLFVYCGMKEHARILVKAEVEKMKLYAQIFMTVRNELFELRHDKKQ